MNQLVIEIIEGHHHPFTVGQGEKMRWKQKAYAHNGGAFPVEFSINLNSQQEALTPATYTLNPKAFRVGRFGDLELNVWELRNNLNMYQPSVAKKAV